MLRNHVTSFIDVLPKLCFGAFLCAALIVFVTPADAQSPDSKDAVATDGENAPAASEPDDTQAKSSAPAVRPATAEDLTGFWKQVEIRSSGEWELDGLYYTGEQFWEFFPDQKARIIVFEDRAPPLSGMQRIREHGPKRTEWTPVEGLEGLIKLVYPNGSTYYILATYFERGVDKALPEPARAERGPVLPEAGDITLTYLDLEKGEPIYFRLLRRRGDVVEPTIDFDNLPPEPLPVEDDPVMRGIQERLERGRGPLDEYMP
ncbi:MAG: hypothetical protein ACFB21_08710 [Opitutales bacterium]